MQRTVAIFVDLHPGLEQVIVGHARRKPGHPHVWLALQDQPHIHPSAGRVADLAQQAEPGKEVGVGDHHPALRLAQYLAVNLLDVGLVFPVVAVHQPHLAIVIAEGQFRTPLPTAVPPVFGVRRATALQQGKVMDVGHGRTLNFHGIILFGLGAEVGQMIGGKIDPADERDGAIDHHDLAVQAPEPVGADAQAFRCRIEHLQVHAGRGKGVQEPGTQFAAAEAVEADGSAHATLGGFDQNLLQLIADLVLEQNEGLQQDFILRPAQGFKHPGKIRLAIFQQLDPIAALPAVFDIDRCRLAGGRSGDVFQRVFFHRLAAHSSISTDSGAWSERCDQGREVSTCGWLALRLRT
ncbi:hypothetical protein D9M71_117030 [compost metagenome]